MSGSAAVRGRVARAIIGWLPIAFGIGWLVGEMTGCGRFAATCDGVRRPVRAAPPGRPSSRCCCSCRSLASMTAMAALAAARGAAVAAALILSATGDAADGDSRRAALGAVLLVAWLVGLAIAVVRRRPRAARRRPRPVS